MANRQTLIDTYQNNPTLQSRYTQQQYLDLFGFGQSTTPPAPPPPTTPTPPDDVTNIIGQNLREDPANRNLVDTTDYMTFDKRNYFPGGKLEINPAALQIGFNPDGSAKGIASFPQTPEQQAFQARLDAGGPFLGPTQNFAIQAGTVPAKTGAMDKGYFTGQKTYKTPRTIGEQVYASQLSQGDTSKLREFMQANIKGLPGDLTRQELVDAYNNYSQFLGRQSNYATARLPGTFGKMIDYFPGIGTVKRGLEKVFGPAGDKSMRDKYSVDNAGFGQGTQRDEFGVFTGQKNDGFLGILGNPTGKDYLDRMNERVDELTDFFSGERKTFGGKKKEGTFKSVDNFKERIANFDDMDEADQQALINEMKAINGFYTKQFFAYKKNRIPIETFNREEKEKKEKEEQRKKDEKAGAFSDQVQLDPGSGGSGGGGGGSWKQQTAAKERQKQQVAGPGFGKGAYFEDGGRVYLYDRQEMENGGSTDDSEAAALRKKVEELMDDGYDFGEAVREAMRQGYDNGGPISESDFPFLINRPGENMGRKKPSLDYYDKYEDSPDDEYPIIEIPMGKMMKKKTKKKKKKKNREDYSDGGRVYLYDRQD
jgi:hypothetical protein